MSESPDLTLSFGVGEAFACEKISAVVVGEKTAAGAEDAPRFLKVTLNFGPALAAADAKKGCHEQ